MAKFSSESDRSIKYLAMVVCVLAAVSVITFAIYGWTHAGNRSRISLQETLANGGDLVSARAVAHCYETECDGLPQTLILACAWRQVATERQGANADDAAEKDRVCGSLSEKDLAIVVNAKTGISQRIEKAAGRAPKS